MLRTRWEGSTSKKQKYLVIDNDCSAFAAKGADKDSLQFSREYELDITQGNSAECDLLSYTTGIEEESIVWNGEQITVTIPYATDWSLLKSEYTCSYDAKVEALNGEDFQNSEKTPIVYRVTAENNTTCKDYSVVVKKIPAATNNRLVAFRFGILKGNIDHAAGTVSLELPTGTSKRFAPIIELPQYATVSPASGEVQDFTNPVRYTVTAQNDDKKNMLSLSRFQVSRQTIRKRSGCRISVTVLSPHIERRMGSLRIGNG